MNEHESKNVDEMRKKAPVKVEPVNKNRFSDSAILLWCLNHWTSIYIYTRLYSGITGGRRGC